MDPQFEPMTLGDIFEKTCSLFGKTFARNLVIAALFLLGPFVILVIAADVFHSSIGDLEQFDIHALREAGFDALMSIAGAGLFLGFAIVMAILCTLFAEIAISIIVSREMLSQPIRCRDAIDQTFFHRWISGTGQGLVKYFLIGSVVILGVVTAILAIVLKSLISIALVLCLFAIIAMIFYLVIQWYFSLTAVAVDDMDVTDSLRKSWHLVKGHWWRTFGILLFLYFLSQCIITIVAMPITFASMGDVYKEMFSVHGKIAGSVDPETLQQIQKSAVRGVGINAGFNIFLSLLITPIYTVVMYFDLRARSTDSPRRTGSTS